MINGSNFSRRRNSNKHSNLHQIHISLDVIVRSRNNVEQEEKRIREKNLLEQDMN